MAPERLDELQALCDACKEGPWEWIAIDSTTLALGTEGCADMEGHVLWTHARCKACEERDAPCMWPSEAHSKFIAEARTALPELIAALREERKKSGS